MKTFFLVLAGLCFLGFLFSISPWLGMGGIFLSCAYYFSTRKPKAPAEPPLPKTQSNDYQPSKPAEEFRIERPYLQETTKADLPSPATDVQVESIHKAPDVSNPYGFKLGKVGSFVLLVALSTAVRLGFREWKKSQVDAEVKASQFEEWPDSTRVAFESSCSTSVKDTTDKETVEAVLSRPNGEGIFNTYAKEYCSCMRVVVEYKHLIPTKYNPSRTTIDGYKADIQAIASRFYNSPEGKQAAEKCDEKAGEVARKFASEE